MSGFKFGTHPSPSSYCEEIVDFWEMEAIKQKDKGIGIHTILKVLRNELDEIQVSGLESDEDELNEKSSSFLKEVEDRRKNCLENYPFRLDGSRLYFEELVFDKFEKGNAYVFMLLATRLDMSKCAVLRGVDGTKLFEKLSLETAIQFWGETKVNGILFGTSSQGKFSEKVEKLASELGEGARYKSIDPVENPRLKDGNVDLVLLKGFRDKRKGQFIAVGQCKTGTNWPSSIGSFDPDLFFRDNFTEPPLTSPVPLYFLSDTMIFELNYYRNQGKKLVFNRTRIVEYLPPSLPEELI